MPAGCPVSCGRLGHFSLKCSLPPRDAPGGGVAGTLLPHRGFHEALETSRVFRWLLYSPEADAVSGTHVPNFLEVANQIKALQEHPRIPTNVVSILRFLALKRPKAPGEARSRSRESAAEVSLGFLSLIPLRLCKQT